MRCACPRDAPRPPGAAISTRLAHTTRADAGRSDACNLDHSRGTRGTAASPVWGIALAARKPVEMACHACRPSDCCICSSHRHVRKHGSQAHREHAVVGTGGVLPALSDALAARALVPRRGGAEQLARDPHLLPQARGERSERWRLREATTRREARGRGARGRTSSRLTTLRDARTRRTTPSAGPRSDPGSRRAHRVVSEADGLGRITCCDGRAERADEDTLSAALESREQARRARTRWNMPGGHLGSGRRARRGAPGLCWPLSPSAPCTCTVRYTRTHELGVHVAGRNGHVVRLGWPFHTVSSHVAASSDAGARVLDTAACSDAVCGLGALRRGTATETAVAKRLPKRFRG